MAANIVAVVSGCGSSESQLQLPVFSFERERERETALSGYECFCSSTMLFMPPAPNNSTLQNFYRIFRPIASGTNQRLLYG